MKLATEFAARTSSLSATAGWVAPHPLLEGLSWRLIGLATLFALPIPLYDLLEGLINPDPLNWSGTLLSALDYALEGLSVLVFAVVLGNLRNRALPRPAALALAVVLGALFASALFELPWAFASFERVRPSTGSYIGNVLWLARRAMLLWGFVAAAWYFAQRIAVRTVALREAEFARHQLEARIVEARLQVMQAQMEPHFLFNTLAHVKRLYRTNPVLARTMLDRFCDYLRASLPQMRGDGATLGRELDLARAYLDVQKIRMGRRLSVAIDVPVDLSGRSFPSMMLLTIVENAIKHGLSPLPAGGRIVISARERSGTLRVSVTDTGAGFSTTKGAGVGLSNIRARLVSLHGAAGSLTLAPNSPGGIVATIAIPAGTVGEGRPPGPDDVKFREPPGNAAAYSA